MDQAATQILDLNTKTESGLTHMKNIVQDAFAMIEERFKKKEAITGVATGFHKFDEMTAGFQPGDLIIVAGRPSMGKTALALNMAQYAALKKKVPTAVFSLEMSKESLVMRMLTSEGRINGNRIRAGMLKDAFVRIIFKINFSSKYIFNRNNFFINVINFCCYIYVIASIFINSFT